MQRIVSLKCYQPIKLTKIVSSSMLIKMCSNRQIRATSKTVVASLLEQAELAQAEALQSTVPLKRSVE